MSLSFENLPSQLDESISVDMGEGVVGTITLVGYADDEPIFRLEVDGNTFIGTAEFVLAQVEHYRQRRKLMPAPHYELREYPVPTPSGTRTEQEWVLVQG
ncbi:hypothetical protein [Ralstonia syzygii]|uniref:Uncharacterized protein n=1 Tax=Ralstonia syzygii R24 TaxID=907261 RepID=G3A1N6_9RALS|nr:hypothetical protein [Ralstonia syzygii]CCA85140.1 conserved hypothetical protein [Ralstonia syzygii R24]